MIILGIDPGIAKTGYGIIKIENPTPKGRGSSNKIKQRKSRAKTNNLKVVDYGCILTNPSLSPGERLKKINQELNKIIRKHNPKVLAIENIYFFKNLKTAMPVSQAKGVILLTAAKKKIPVYEFTPLQMKMAVVGYGKAEKKQVQEMIKIILNLKEAPKIDDTADALGIALCYVFKLKGEIKSA